MIIHSADRLPLILPFQPPPSPNRAKSDWKYTKSDQPTQYRMTAGMNGPPESSWIIRHPLSALYAGAGVPTTSTLNSRALTKSPHSAPFIPRAPLSRRFPK